MAKQQQLAAVRLVRAATADGQLRVCPSVPLGKVYIVDLATVHWHASQRGGAREIVQCADGLWIATELLSLHTGEGTA